MAITPMFFEQIEKFQCLSSSTTQGLSTGILRIHVTRVTCPQTCPKNGQLFLVQNPPKTTMIDFNDNTPKNTSTKDIFSIGPPSGLIH